MSAKNSPIWTPEKVSELISLYEANECLWNFKTAEYKNRMKRDEAIRKVCGTLNITKEQFAKKIHNLRNQFNFELKKRERRSKDVKDSGYAVRWEHFDRLLFLRKFISHRAGYGNDTNTFPDSPTPCEHTNIESEECVEVAETTSFLKQESTQQANTQVYETQETESQQNQTIEMPTALNLIVEEDHQYVEHPLQASTPKVSASPFEASNSTIIHQTVAKKPRLSRDSNSTRDECDTFAEFVANELRNLSSDFSRKKMKRKIMQAMLEVWNEEDEVNINICLN